MLICILSALRAEFTAVGTDLGKSGLDLGQRVQYLRPVFYKMQQIGGCNRFSGAVRRYDKKRPVAFLSGQRLQQRNGFTRRLKMGGLKRTHIFLQSESYRVLRALSRNFQRII